MMSIKDLWSRVKGWFEESRLFKSATYDSNKTDDDELLVENPEPVQQSEEKNIKQADNQTLVKKHPETDKSESLEKLQVGFNRLIEQLENINGHLDQQVSHYQGFMNRMENLPELMEKFPSLIENQKQLTERLFEELKVSTTKNQQFIDVVEEIPIETAKQTNTLVNIDHQLSAAADIDVQMVENFNRFNLILEKLNQNTAEQANSTVQMKKTFAASDRYLKYLMLRQNKRFIWIFIISVGISLLSILILTGIILYIKPLLSR